MELVRTTLRRCDVAGDRTLMLEGAVLTSERLRSIIQLHWVANGIEPVTPIAAGGPQGADPHEHGTGPLRAGEPIVFDLFPRDETTRVYGDMTRTFCVGTPSDEAAAAHAACEAAITAAIAACRPGIMGRELHILVCDLFRDRGFPSQIHPAASVPNASEWTFSHGLGHGVGFHVHEPPGAGTQGFSELEEGDSLTIEPGLYRPGRRRLPDRGPRDPHGEWLPQPEHDGLRAGGLSRRERGLEAPRSGGTPRQALLVGHQADPDVADAGRARSPRSASPTRPRLSSRASAQSSADMPVARTSAITNMPASGSCVAMPATSARASTTRRARRA